MKSMDFYRSDCHTAPGSKEQFVRASDSPDLGSATVERSVSSRVETSATDVLPSLVMMHGAMNAEINALQVEQVIAAICFNLERIREKNPVQVISPSTGRYGCPWQRAVRDEARRSTYLPG